MQVSGSLPTGRANVEADVVTVGLPIDVEPMFDLANWGQDVGQLLVGGCRPMW
jgi:hypothetical protein